MTRFERKRKDREAAGGDYFCPVTRAGAIIRDTSFSGEE